MAETKGVLAQHRDRMKNDEDYRRAALSVSKDSPITTGKHLDSTAPLSTYHEG